MTDKGKLPSICVFTLGCKVNLYDSDAMLKVFDECGFQTYEGLKRADIYVINTCAVTAEAEKKSRQAVARIKKLNPQAQIYVCGCASQRNAAQFERDGVLFVGGADNKLQLARNIAEAYADGGSVKFGGDPFEISSSFEEADGVLNMRTRHFVKVQDGCNNFCSYCIIPYLRGRSRSRSQQSVLSELDGAKERGVKEFVITGINLSAYGKDNGSSLTDLLLALRRYGDMRIRLGSLEVGVIDDDFLEATAQLPGFCPHFHLSLQSGDDGVLSAMNRHYTTDFFFEKTELIRRYYPDAALTTDIIVGFPTETEAAFEAGLEFANKVRFADIHVFPYSSRSGTVAGKLKTLPPATLDERTERMLQLKRRLFDAYISSHIGVQGDVLFESEEDGLMCGHMPNYIKVYSKHGERNEIRRVTPVAKYKDGLICD